MTSQMSRRTLLAGAATPASAMFLPAAPAVSQSSDTIRPFRISVPQADLDDLQRRLAATPWPDKETVEDQTRGGDWGAVVTQALRQLAPTGLAGLHIKPVAA